MPRSSPLSAIFKRKVRYGSVNTGAMLGIIHPQRVSLGTAAETDTAGVFGLFRLPAGLVHWFDFSVGGSLSLTGSTINSITDLKNGFVLSNAAGTVQATTIGTNGLNCGRNNAYGGPFNRLTATGTSLPTGQPYWVSCVGRVTPKPGGAEGNKGTFFNLNSTATPLGRTGSLIFDSDNHIMLTAGGSIESTADIDTATHSFFWIFNSSSSLLYVDGVQVASGNGGSNGTAAGGQLTLFNVHTGGVESDTAIGEILFGSGVPAASAVTAEHSRLTGKWGF